MEGMVFFEPGGMRTRRSGLRLLMVMIMGGGDLACMFLLMFPGETSRPGELRWFPYPFPVGQSERTLVTYRTRLHCYRGSFYNKHCKPCQSNFTNTIQNLYQSINADLWKHIWFIFLIWLLTRNKSNKKTYEALDVNKSCPHIWIKDYLTT